MNEPQTSNNHPKQPRRLQALQRRRQALQMRLAGADVAEIAAALGVTPGRVSQLIGEAMAELQEGIKADAEQMREMQRRDIMVAIQAIKSKSLTSSDPGERMAAADRIVRLWARLSALYGLDEPTRINEMQMQTQINFYLPQKDAEVCKAGDWPPK